MNKNAETIFSYLREEGFRPELTENKDIFFKFEGNKFVIIFNAEYEDFISICKYVGLDCGEEAEFDIYKLVNKVNKDYNVGKCFVIDEEEYVLVLRIDFLGTATLFLENFELYIKTLKWMEEDFSDGYNKIVQ